MASRSQDRAAAAIKRLEDDLAMNNKLGNGKVGAIKFLHCDLASPVSANAAAADFLNQETRLDVLGKCFPLVSVYVHGETRLIPP